MNCLQSNPSATSTPRITAGLMLLVIFSACGIILAQTPVDNHFTYQGLIKQNGAPFNGSCNFSFSLYSVPTSGSALGAAFNAPGITVANGLFTAQLEFAANAFNGEKRWLEIQAQCPAATGVMTTLSPRQELTATPYAAYALQAGGGGVTAVTASAPLASSGGTTPNISLTTPLADSNLDTISSAGKVLNSATTATSSNAVGAIVARDFFGNFSAGTITASLNGTATSATNATTAINFSGGLSGDVTGTQAATSVIRLQGRYLASIAPTDGQVLKWNGMMNYWVPEGDNNSGGTITEVTASTPLAVGGSSTAPNIFFNGILPITNGGTGSGTQSFVDLSSVQSVSGFKTFGNASASPPFGVASTGLVTNLDSDKLDGLHAEAFKRFGPNIKVVAKSGGDYTTITAALNSITDANAANHYLVYVAPGIYTERVIMKPYVDIEGAGEGSTKITLTGNTSSSTGTVEGANNAELRFLTVENTGGSAPSYATAIYNRSASPRIMHVTADASGGSLNNVSVNNSESSSPTMTNVTATASGGSMSIGVGNWQSSARIQNSNISASGGTSNLGIYNFASAGTYTVLVNNSQIKGSTRTITNNSQFTTLISASKLEGGAVTNPAGGTLTCVVSYNANYAPLTSACVP